MLLVHFNVRFQNVSLKDVGRCFCSGTLLKNCSNMTDLELSNNSSTALYHVETNHYQLNQISTGDNSSGHPLYASPQYISHNLPIFLTPVDLLLVWFKECVWLRTWHLFHFLPTGFFQVWLTTWVTLSLEMLLGCAKCTIKLSTFFR
jgi:hypothetical protein